MRATTGTSFPAAVAAGLAMLAGDDIITRFQGHELRGHFWSASGKPTGLVMLCPGFTEFCEKHSGTCHALHERGFDVLVIDWPGQGRSGHFGANPLAVHIDSFETYLDAMDTMLDAAGLTGRPMLLMGHSMGGHLALRLARRYADKVQGVILTAPMVLPPVVPALGVRLLARLLCLLGWRHAFPPFHRTRSLAEASRFHSDNMLTSWEPGYAAQFLWMQDDPALRRSGPTVGWVRAAYESCARTTMDAGWMSQIAVPVLALTAADERIVYKAATDRMLPFLPQIEWHEMADARHEILQENPEIVATAWAHIDSFVTRIL